MIFKYKISLNSIKRLILICFMTIIVTPSYSQCEIIKTNLSTYIKTGLLAPTSFKIHRYSCEQISPSVQKLQSGLKKQKADIKDRYAKASKLTDSLDIVYTELSHICDSLNAVIQNSPNRIEKKRLEAKIRETKVINVPRDHEFILWQSDRGMDTTMSSLAFSYSNQIKKIPEDPNENIYKEHKTSVEALSKIVDASNRLLLLLIEQGELADLYIEKSKELPIYKAYIVYQALNKGGQNALSEEIYYFNKNYKCLGKEYSEFWNEVSILE
jgi:hypothetical protein